MWAFEGFTSYYDDLFLLRSGVIDRASWLELIGETLTNVRKTPGRQVQSLSESSFDAWIKYYRQDENTPNAVVSYYTKGALFGLALDLTLRAGGKATLDAVMQALWQRHGLTGLGVGDEDIRRIAEELSGLSLKRFFADYTDGTRELPLERLLATAGLRLEWIPDPKAKHGVDLGIRTRVENNEVVLAAVHPGGAAHAAGLSAGDTLVALDGLRITPATFDALLARQRPGNTVGVHAFRRDELLQTKVTLAPPVADTARLTLASKPNALRRAWLGS